MYKHLLHQLKRLLIVIITVIIIYFISKYMILLLYPFIAATMLAYLINPIVSLLEKKIKVPRIIATLLTISVIVTVISSVIIIILTELIEGTTYLADKIPSYFHSLIISIESFIQYKITPFYHRVIDFVQNLDESGKTTFNDSIHQLASQVADSGTALLKAILLKIPFLFSLLPQSIVTFVFIILATIFITNDWILLKTTFKKLIPMALSDSTQKVFIHLKKSLFGYFKAQMILILIATCIIFISLLVLNIEHALTISLLVAFVDVLPLIGTGIIFIPWSIYLFLTTNYSLAISISILYLFVVLTRQMIEPKILSTQIGLNPLAALFTLFIGIKIWGALLGIIIAPFLLILASSLYQAGTLKQLRNYIKG